LIVASEYDPNAEPHAASTEDPKPRRAYAAPELIEYGTVAKLTQTGGQTTFDWFGTRRMGGMMCL
jgi:hypothetical protein